MNMISGTEIMSPYAELFHGAVRAGHEAGASDIHIEPTRTSVDIRFRISGEMSLWKQLPSGHAQSFIVAVKKQTRLAIGVSGRPQDSRVSVAALGVDLRVSLLPTLFGEKIVLRLLDTQREFRLEHIGIPDDTLRELLHALTYRNGVVLISGPTGSGKTTTLYSLIFAIDRARKNVITLEDPVEYTLSGINQVRIDPKVSFANALRAVLRQDPDVILVGEIRDEETASLAFKAAATGHLVLSTVHANGAAEVVGRLLNLGIDRDTLKENLRFSAAQRLVPRLCPSCAVAAPEGLANEVFQRFPAEDQAARGVFKVKNSDGCKDCVGGVKDRLPAVEYVTRERIETFFQNRDVRLVPVKTLHEATLEFAVRGLADLREVIQIA